MNILWITNIPLNPISEALNLPKYGSGGWMYESLKRLKKYSEFEIAIASTYSGNVFVDKSIDGIRYFLLPLRNKNRNCINPEWNSLWIRIKQSFSPDIIHIHGTEFPYGLSYIESCGNSGVVVSIQGLVSVIARYYKVEEVSSFQLITFRDILRRGGIKNEKKNFEANGRDEVKLLKKVSNIIGRTAWDKAHSWCINQEANYYRIGETLRDSFYQHKWSYSSCEPYSIFISQAGYPIKGFHKVLEAMPIILKQFPKTKIYVAGFDETSKPWFKMTGYGKFMKILIKRFNLKDKVIFTGIMDEAQMCQRYLKSNVFVCCSAIENSPNSLGEAQVLGVPHVTSFVGGVPEIVNYAPEVLYRYEEVEMLASKICDIFDAKDQWVNPYFDKSMYDGQINTLALVDCYRKIHTEQNR